MTNLKPAPPPPPADCSVQEVADTLRVSDATIRRLLVQHAFPNAFRVGKLIRIPRPDVEAFRLRERLAFRRDV
jgi:excisionase family DNA binding protein